MWLGVVITAAINTPASDNASLLNTGLLYLRFSFQNKYPIIDARMWSYE